MTEALNSLGEACLLIASAAVRAPLTHAVNASRSSGGAASLMLPSTTSALWFSASAAGPSVLATSPPSVLKAAT